MTNYLFQDNKFPGFEVTLTLGQQLEESTLTVKKPEGETVTIPYNLLGISDEKSLMGTPWKEIPLYLRSWHYSLEREDFIRLSKKNPIQFLQDLAGIALEVAKGPTKKPGTYKIKQDLKQNGLCLKMDADHIIENDEPESLMEDVTDMVIDTIQNLYALGEHVTLFRFGEPALSDGGDLLTDLKASLDGLKMAKFTELIKAATAAGKITPEIAEQFTAWANL